MTVRAVRALFASTYAGGGHNTIRDALRAAVEHHAPPGTVECESFTAEHGFDQFYRATVRLNLEGIVYGLGSFSPSAHVAVLTNLPLLSEVSALLRRTRPDIVVSTHLVLTASFLVARRTAGLDTRVAGVVPDYGAPNRGFFPRFRWLRPDETWFLGEDSYAAAARDSSTEPGELRLIGTPVASGFTEVARQRAGAGGQALKERWKAELTEAVPGIHALDVTRPTFGFFGGSGFAGKTMPVVERLLADPRCGEAFNVIVLAGRDDQLHARLLERFRSRKGCVVSGFLAQPQLARLVALTDVPVMGSLAHSSLQEFLELGKGPLLVFRLIEGTEPPYVPFLLENRLALVEPDTDKLLSLALQHAGLEPMSVRLAQFVEGFERRARAVRARQEERSGRVVTYLRALASRPVMAPQPIPGTFSGP